MQRYQDDQRGYRYSSRSEGSQGGYQSRRPSSTVNYVNDGLSHPSSAGRGGSRTAASSPRATYASNGRSSYGSAQRSASRGASGASSRSSSRQGSSRQGSSRQAAPQGNGQYNRSQYSQYSRSNSGKYTRGSYTARNVSPQRKRKNMLVAIIVALVVCLSVLGVFVYMHTRPVDIIVNGRTTEVAFNTTYQDLHDQGLLTETNGNLLAVDGSVLQTEGGGTYKIFDNEQLVADYGKRVSAESVITEAKGDNTTEDYDVATTTVPWTYAYEHTDNFNFYNGSLHFYVTNGTDGTEVTHTGKISGITVDATDESIAMVPQQFIDVTCQPLDGQKIVALTFDDGPSTYTEQFLAKLQQYGVKATFFELGSNVEEYPEVSKAVVDAGMQLGSHSYNHDSENYLDRIDNDAVRSQLTQAQTAIYNATGVKVTCVRPPGGNISIDAIEATPDLMTECVGWDIDTEDWQKPGAEAIAQTAVSECESGDIILMHDGGGDRSQTLEALDTIIPELQAKGYTFVTIDELCEIERQSYLAAQAQAAAATS